eukprot:s4633_g3.t1
MEEPAAASASSARPEAGRCSTPPDVTKVEDIFVPERVEKALVEAKDFAGFREARLFRMLHLYSGAKDVLAESIGEQCKKHQLKFQAISLDRKTDAEIDLAQPYAREVLESDIMGCEYDYYHAGFPCNSFSRARWNVGHGPQPVRSAKELYGLATNNASQQLEADTGTVMATSASLMMKKQCHTCKARGVPEMATIENPPGDERAGSAWQLPEIQKDLKDINGEAVDFNTCAFQESKHRWYKPARWGGKLPGLQSLSRVCRCPAWVVHTTLQGKKSTEAAGEYPKNLCDKVAELVVTTWKRILNLEWWRYQVKTKGDQVSELQRQWLANEERRRRGGGPGELRRIKRELEDTLEVGDLEEDHLPRSSAKRSKKEIKGAEDQTAIGGMRNPDLAVERLHMVREVGQKLRLAWDNFVNDFPNVLVTAEQYGSQEVKLDPVARDAWKMKMFEVLGGRPVKDGVTLRDTLEYKSPLDADLWQAWQMASKDPDDSIPTFIREGVPLGMDEVIPGSNGVFPEIRDDTGGPSDPDDPLPELETMKDVTNYVSVRDQPEDAQIEIDRYREKGFVVDIKYEDAVQRFGVGTVSKLALIVKTKPDLTVKRRIVIDLRRSGGNSRCEVGERLILPRICDVLRSLRKLSHLESKLVMEKRLTPTEAKESELFLIDFADAFCHYAVHRNELKNCLSPGLQEGQWLLWIALLFGYRAAPLLMARLSSAVARMVQSMLMPWEAATQIYVDDFLMVAKGPRALREHLLAMAIYTLSAVGMMLSLKKGERGRRVVWIGTSIELQDDLVCFGVPEKMCSEVLQALEAWPSRGQIPLRDLRSITGKLSWIAGIIPRMRWGVSTFYAVLSDAEKDLVANKDSRPTGKATEKLVEDEVVMGIVTDASPLGVGAILVQKSPDGARLVIMEALEAPIVKAEADLLLQEHGASSSQSVMEAFAVLRALKKWQSRLRGQPVLIRSDSVVALSMLRKLGSPSPALNYVGAEISLLLEDMDCPGLRLHHLAGKLNKETDYLSRPQSRGELPANLQGVKLVKLQTWSQEDFTLPPPGAKSTDGRSKWQGTPSHHQSVWDHL